MPRAFAKPAFMIGPDAPRLWLDATKVGELAGYPTEDGKGVLIDEGTIDSLVSNFLAHDDGIPIDGAGISGVHELVDNSAADAAGWILDAEKRVDEEGVAHLWLHAELLPEVAQKIERGSLKYGSIAFAEDAIDNDSGESVGPDLHSYALTNKPFRRGLQPHVAMAEDGETKVVMMSARPLKSVRALGPAKDLRAQLLALLGFTEEDTGEGDFSWKISDRLGAIMNAATVEDVVEGNQAPAAPAQAPEESAMAQTRTKTYALAGLNEDQVDLFLKNAGLDPASFETMADKLQALLEATKAAPAAADPAAIPADQTPAPAPAPAAVATPTLAEGDPAEGESQAEAMTPEQMATTVDAFTQTVRDITGDQALTAEAALEALVANQELLAGALVSPAAAGDEGDGDMGALAELNARLAVLEAANTKLTTELEAEQATALEAKVAEVVAEELGVRNLSANESQILAFSELLRGTKAEDGTVDLAAGREKLAGMLTLSAGPPRSRAFSRKAPTPDGRSVADPVAEMRRLTADLKAADPKLSTYDAQRQARRQLHAG